MRQTCKSRWANQPASVHANRIFSRGWQLRIITLLFAIVRNEKNATIILNNTEKTGRIGQISTRHQNRLCIKKTTKWLIYALNISFCASLHLVKYEWMNEWLNRTYTAICRSFVHTFRNHAVLVSFFILFCPVFLTFPNTYPCFNP